MVHANAKKRIKQWEHMLQTAIIKREQNPSELILHTQRHQNPSAYLKG